MCVIKKKVTAGYDSQVIFVPSEERRISSVSVDLRTGEEGLNPGRN